MKKNKNSSKQRKMTDEEKVRELATVFEWGEFAPPSVEKDIDNFLFIKQKIEQAEEYDK
ncbi:MAG TPA: hypothetical protein GXX38_02350 [Clostridia bacterium]|nr:hypothetical protein [Clostridia bacterium]